MSAAQWGHLASRALSIWVLVQFLNAMSSVMSIISMARQSPDALAAMDIQMWSLIGYTIALGFVWLVLWTQASWVGEMLAGRSERISPSTVPVSPGVIFRALGVFLFATGVPRLVEAIVELNEAPERDSESAFFWTRVGVLALALYLIVGRETIVRGLRWYWRVDPEEPADSAPKD